MAGRDQEHSERIYQPHKEPTKRQPAAYFNLESKQGQSRVRQSTDTQVTGKQTISSEPVRATNIFALQERDSVNSEVQLIKERIEREFQKISESKNRHQHSASDVESKVNIPKDSSGGTSWNTGRHVSSKSNQHEANNEDEQKRLNIGMLPTSSRVSPEEDVFSRSYSRTDRDVNYLPEIPPKRQESGYDNKNDSRESIVEKINMLQPGKTLPYAAEVRDQSSLATIPESTASLKRPERSEYIKIEGQSEKSAQGEVSIQKQSQESPANEERYQGSKKNSPPASLLLHKRLLQMELETVERQILEHTRKLVEANSIVDSIRDASYAMISARQSELKYLEVNHQQTVNLLNERIDVENSMFEQLWRDLLLPADE